MKRYLQERQEIETLRQLFDNSGFSIFTVPEVNTPEKTIRVPIKTKYGKKINKIHRGLVHCS